MNYKKPMFSIITVCLNSENTIFKTIRSVTEQKSRNFEYIIVDGLSTDNTLKIVNDELLGVDFYYKIISEKDTGIYDAMNKGIQNSKGQYIGILNSDDWYDKNVLRIVEKEFQKNSQSIIYGLLKMYTENEEDKAISWHHNFLNKENIAHPTMFVPMDIYKKHGLYDTKYKIAADYDFSLRLKKEHVTFRRNLKIITNYNSQGASSKQNKVSSLEKIKIQKHHNIISLKKYICLFIVIYIKYVLKSMRSVFIGT